ncbi:hypothetical protein Q5P01_002300 [Channa striata]|uniref:Uncharacterized protein n=1 Tax=Channa striata TaxID=64152 RepID=A0AA88NQ93_CHASR|nr:hypothetical protein Q5P01_002300 [Channa striata]
MAAATAALSRNRGVTSVRATKGLFFVFTLLCLLCPASSRIERDKLKELREELQALKHAVHWKKAQNKLASDFATKVMDDAVLLFDPLTRLLRETVPEFTAMSELMENLKHFMVSTKAYVQKKMQTEAAETERFEEKLKILDTKLTHPEQYDEL